MNIPPEQWPRLSELLDQLLDLPPAQRQQWLDTAGEVAAEHHAVLRRLLESHARAETAGFLHEPASLGLPGSPGPAAEAGGQVGPYRLLQPVGQGGMASVWLAERSDGQPRRHVALKLPHAGAATRSFTERLARERDILAALEHPNIARLYDAGVAPSGQAYIALAFVDGQPIDEHCRQRLPLAAQRVALFKQALEAVRFAHSRLVVHRDLKPSNILVDTAGRVQLLDFGIAKLLAEDADEASTLTVETGRPLTLDYAAPEQIAGAPASTASDVYSLGVVLYQLLAGRRPYTLQRQEPQQMAEALRLLAVPRPGSLAGQPGAAQGVATDLDWIVLKAMEPELSRRYASVEAFADDLVRLEAGEPVRARPASAAYRARKFVGRHRWPVAMASGVLAALLAGGAAAAWEAHVAGSERDHALQLLARNEAVTQFMDLFINEAAQSPKPLAAAELLQRGEALAEREFGREPEQRAVVLASLGMHERALGNAQRAEALLARAVEAGAGSADASFSTRLACQHAVARLMIGQADAARQTLREAAARPATDEAVVAECLAYLSFLEAEANDGPAATTAAQQALDHLRLSARRSPSLEASYVAALADGLHLSGRNDEAGRAYAKSLEAYAALGREAAPNAIAIRNNWAVMLDGLGDPKAALALYERNLAFADASGQSPPVYLLANRARALELMGRTADAGQAYQRALEAARAAGNPNVARYCLAGLGGIAVDGGRADEARQRLQEIAAPDSGAAGGGGPVPLAARLLRGRIALLERRADDAASDFAAVLANRKPIGATVFALIGQGEAEFLAGRLDEALRDARDAAALGEKLQGGASASVRTGLARELEGRVLERRAEREAAAAAFREAQRHLAATVDPAHPVLARLGAGP